MTDYSVYLGPLLVAGGVLLQWVRAFKWVQDSFSLTLGAVLAFGAYFLTSDWELWHMDPRLFTIRLILGGASAVSTLYGGTFVASQGAKGAVAMGANPAHVMVPLTDSK